MSVLLEDMKNKVKADHSEKDLCHSKKSNSNLTAHFLKNQSDKTNAIIFSPL